MKKKYQLSDYKELASKLADNLSIGDVIALQGDLGAGKTTLAKFIINSLSGKNEEVTSPTFTLVQTIPINNDKIKNVEIWHFDLYRLEEKQEVYELGIEDALDSAISIIEWPELIEDILPKKKTIKVQIDFVSGNDNEREITITCGDEKLLNSL